MAREPGKLTCCQDNSTPPPSSSPGLTYLTRGKFCPSVKTSKDNFFVTNWFDFTACLNRLADFAKLYDVIKNERNKCVNLIQTSTQVSCVRKSARRGNSLMILIGNLGVAPAFIWPLKVMHLSMLSLRGKGPRAYVAGAFDLYCLPNPREFD